MPTFDRWRYRERERESKSERATLQCNAMPAIYWIHMHAPFRTVRAQPLAPQDAQKT